MILSLLREAGHEEALLGLSLSYYDHSILLSEFWTEEKYERAKKRAIALAHKGAGHNKFIESIQVWLFVQSSRDFWSEFDTYRAGMSKQSSSTCHTLNKRLTTPLDFDDLTTQKAIDNLNEVITEDKKDINRIKKNLPEGWLQERVVCTNYKTLQNIVRQREKHRLTEWQEFVDALLEVVEYPEYIRTP